MAFELPQKVEEGRGLLRERGVKASDAREAPLGFWQLTLGDTTLHVSAAYSTVRTKVAKPVVMVTPFLRQ